ncbi:Fc.00g037330.m01.CDS01 [Cosmosporella sp. VM-42]
MSQNGKNASITSFFKPKPKQKPPRSPPPTSSLTPVPPSPLPPSSPVSQSVTPVKSKSPLKQDVVIQASDDEDDFGASSDDSLEDLSTILGRGRPTNPVRTFPRTTQNPFATPRAKRTAVEFHSSPLAFMPKHKFDLKALAKDARKDDATNESSMRVKAAVDQADDEDEDSSGEASRSAFEDIVKEKGGQNAEKVLRAVQRTDGAHSTYQYCFFDLDYTTPPSTTSPKSAKKGHWRLLTQGNIHTREQHLASGLPMVLLSKHGGLPDELFDWILDELCIQKSALIREEYCNLIFGSAEQVERMMTPQRLEELFLRLGASDELAQKDSELAMSKSNEQPYGNRDWGNMGSFLDLLGSVAHCLSLSSVAYAAQTLIRMSVDKMLIYNVDLLVDYQKATDALIEAIPRPSWDNFCFETCLLLHTIVKVQSLRVNALVCLPTSKTLVHELRRRLGVALLFDDPSLGRHHPDDMVTIKGVIDRLGQDDFSVGPKTDFAELRAGIILLNITIDDGSFVITDDLDEEKKFNQEIDELAVRLREIWRKINDAGMKLARTEAKSVIEWVQQRLSHSVRTRRKAKKSVFDPPSQKEDPFLPRQQDYMKSFLKKSRETPALEPPALIDEDTIVVAGG